ncbi:hypothetical protein, partial [Thermus scotoductus]|uniref:hypothetical protein n=1 Tax=Thermus scotoductus TaxID=37636 RepID=UPI001C12BFDA
GNPLESRWCPFRKGQVGRVLLPGGPEMPEGEGQHPSGEGDAGEGSGGRGGVEEGAEEVARG